MSRLITQRLGILFFLMLVSSSCLALEPRLSHIGKLSSLSGTQIGYALSPGSPVTHSLADTYVTSKKRTAANLKPTRPLGTTGFTPKRPWSHRRGRTISLSVLSSSKPKGAFVHRPYTQQTSNLAHSMSRPDVMATGLNASRYRQRSTGIPSRYR